MAPRWASCRPAAASWRSRTPNPGGLTSWLTMNQVCTSRERSPQFRRWKYQYGWPPCLCWLGIRCITAWNIFFQHQNNLVLNSKDEEVSSTETFPSELRYLPGTSLDKQGYHPVWPRAVSWHLEENVFVSAKIGQPRPVFHLFLAFRSEKLSSLQDLNLDCRNRRQGSKPQDHHGPNSVNV